MSALITDIRTAARTLRRTPWFTTLAVTIVAVGIGLTTALFSLVDAVVFRPLPYFEAHRLVEIWGRDDQRTGMRVPGPILETLRARATSLQAIGTHDPTGGEMRTSDGLIDIRGEAVSANFVDVFGVRPIAGRAFVADDAHPGAPAVMIVSFAFWQRHLGGAANAVGRVVYLDEVPYTIVGVMPPSFATRFETFRPEFWTPYAGLAGSSGSVSRSRDREREAGYELVGRLAPGVTLDQASSEAAAIAAGIDIDSWRRNGRRIGMVPLKEDVVQDRGYALQLLLAAVAVVLAIACANLAQLLLARSDGRLVEFATRKAIGAASASIFRLALCESLLLSIGGGVLGVVLAYRLLPAMLALAPAEIPRLSEATLDARVLAIAVLMTVITGCAFGFAPALRLARLSVVDAMKASGRMTPQRARFRSALVVAQVAAAVALTALAGLVAQTFFALLPSSPGFVSASRATFFWSIRDTAIAAAIARRDRVFDLARRIQGMPGIASVAVASSIPFEDDDARNVPIRLPDDLAPVNERTMRTELRAVSANYLTLLQIPMLQGRSFDSSDTAESERVAIVNSRLARRLDPAGNVLGLMVRVGSAPTAPLYRVVGVAADTRWSGVNTEVLNEVLTPFSQSAASYGYFIIESSLDAATLTKTIRGEMQAVLPSVALQPDRRAVMLDDTLRQSVARPRFSATLISSFAAVAFGLAVVGLGGLVMYSVSQRRRELGIRAALGARPRALVLACVRSALSLTGFGIVIGLAAGTSLTRFLESQLYAIEPLDLPTFAGAAVTMMAAATIAVYLPARRAVRSDPMTCLRHE